MRLSSFFGDLKMLTKLALPVAITAVSLIGVILVIWFAVDALEQDVQVALANRAPQVRLTVEAQLHFADAAINEKNVLLSVGNAQAIEQYAKLYRDDIDKAQRAMRDVRELTTGPTQVALVEQFMAAVRERAANSEEVFKLCAAGDMKAAVQRSQVEGKAARLKALRASEELAGIFQHDLSAATQAIADSGDRVRYRTLIAAVVGLAISASLIFWIGLTQVARPIRRMAARMESLASGEL